MRKIFYALGIVFIVAALSLYLLFVFPVNHQSQNMVKFQSENISAVVLPHFDFAATDRAKMLDNLSKKTDPKKIVLVSVNHFNSGNDDIIATDQNWNFSDVKVKPEHEVFKALTEGGLAAADPDSFFAEHGIKNVLPDIAKAFPDAQVLPVMIKDSSTKEKIKNLASALYEKCPDCLLISSIDFSHYNPNSLAELHDQTSLAALQEEDPDKAFSAETDSPQAMYLTADWAAKHKGQFFNLVENSNSGEAQRNDSIETTSYILGYYSQVKPKDILPKESTFLFGGDMMLDRLVNHDFKDQGLEHIFDNFGNRVFWGTDISMVNLEGPISSVPISDDVSTDNLSFNFPPETGAVLNYLHIGSVSLANNHTMNAGAEGFDSTKKMLEKSGILYAGSESDFNDSSTINFKSDVPISVVCVNMLTNPSITKITDAIKSEKLKGNFVIIFPHWGTEYQTKHSSAQQSVAHQFIDAGADAIFGSHPHVVQDLEVYNEKPIIYSMGNLVFDQQFSALTQQGLLLGGKITKDSFELSFFPVKSVDLMPQLMQGDEKQGVIDKLLKGQTELDMVRSDTIKLNR